MRGSASMLWVFFLIGIFHACGDSDPKTAEVGGQAQAVLDLLAAGKPAEAAQILDALKAGERKEGWALYCRGRVALHEAEHGDETGAASKLKEAASFLKEAIDLSSSDYLSWVFLGRAQGLAGQLVDGIKTLETAVRISPRKGDAYFELGRLYKNSGEIEAAMEIINQGLEMEPGRADGKMLYGSIVFDFRNLFDEGLVSMRDALKIDPDLPGGKEKLASSLMYLAVKSLHGKENEDVLLMVDEVLKLFPDHAEALQLRAQVYARTDQTGKAIEDLRRCIALDPKDVEACRLLSRALIKKGYQLLFLKRRDEALGLFREAVALDAPDVDTTVVARILEEDQRQAEEKPQEGTPPDSIQEARSLFEKASVLLEAGEAKQALACLRQSTDLLPNNPYAHHQTGLALDMLGQTEEAEAELKLAVSLGAVLEIRIPATYLKLAEIAIKAERYAEGEKYLDQFDKLFPNQGSNPMAITLRRQLLLH
ncbi:MAG: tetratricopeptide repeat protein [Planctomycetota bacterium]